MPGRGALPVFVALLALLAGCAGPAADAPGGPSPTTVAGGGGRVVTVLEIVDGDTLEVRLPGGERATVRLLGVDTPEVHAENRPGEYEGVPNTTGGARCLRRAGENASAFLERWLGDAPTIRVSTDPEADRRDPYGRLLVYATYRGESVNRRLVEAGHARVYDTTFARAEEYYAAEADARAAGRGLWRCRSPG